MDEGLWAGERILPVQPGEARKIRVRAIQKRIVFNRKRGKMSVGRQIAAGHRPGTEPAKDFPVARTGMKNLDGRLGQPGIDNRKRGGERRVETVQLCVR